jgi:hypothetical protein
MKHVQFDAAQGLDSLDRVSEDCKLFDRQLSSCFGGMGLRLLNRSTLRKADLSLGSSACKLGILLGHIKVSDRMELADRGFAPLANSHERPLERELGTEEWCGWRGKASVVARGVKRRFPGCNEELAVYSMLKGRISDNLRTCKFPGHAR